MCGHSARLGRGRPLPLLDKASRACSKAVGEMNAHAAGPSTPSLLVNRDGFGHYREQVVAPPCRHSRRLYQIFSRSIIDMRPVSTLAIVFVHQHSLRCSARVAAHTSWRLNSIRSCTHDALCPSGEEEHCGYDHSSYECRRRSRHRIHHLR